MSSQMFIFLRYVTTVQGQKLSDFLIKKKSHSEKYTVHYNLIRGLFQLKWTFYCIFSSAISLKSGSWTTGEHEIHLANSEKYLSKRKRKNRQKLRIKLRENKPEYSRKQSTLFKNF